MTSADLAEKREWANTLAGSTLLPAAYQKQPANLFLAAEYADTLGVPRMAALTGIHVIQGKPTMSADLMAAQVRRLGHKLRVKATDTQATAQLIRSDDPDFTFECVWTLDRAKRAGLLSKRGGNWQAYPAAMLKARAVSEVIREGASEVFFGAVYTPEELGAPVDASGEPTEEIQPTPVTQPAMPETPATQPVPQALVDEIIAHTETLRLDRDTLEKTLRYVCHNAGATLNHMTVEDAEALADYLAGRVETQEAEVLEGETSEGETLEGETQDGAGIVEAELVDEEAD